MSPKLGNVWHSMSGISTFQRITHELACKYSRIRKFCLLSCDPGYAWLISGYGILKEKVGKKKKKKYGPDCVAEAVAGARVNETLH